MPIGCFLASVTVVAILGSMVSFFMFRTTIEKQPLRNLLKMYRLAVLPGFVLCAGGILLAIVCQCIWGLTPEGIARICRAGVFWGRLGNIWCSLSSALLLKLKSSPSKIRAGKELTCRAIAQAHTQIQA